MANTQARDMSHPCEYLNTGIHHAPPQPNVMLASSCTLVFVEDVFNRNHDFVPESKQSAASKMTVVDV
jgi:hypothetical protein